MTRQEYEDFEQAVADFFEREGITSLSCPINCEPYFSWKWCDCCQRTQGGDRHEASGYNPTTKQIYTYSVCPDCIYYAEYGQLDDMTMLDIAQSAE